MNRLLATAAALAVLSAPALALAQDQEHHDRGGGGGGHQPAPQAQPQFHGPQGGGHPQFQGGPGGQHPQFQGGQPGFQRPQGVVQPQAQPNFQGGRQGFQGRPQFQGGQQPGFQGRPQGNFDRGDHGGFDRGGDRGGFHGARPGGQQFSVGGRSFFRYRAEPYRYPYAYRGWDHHYWRRGEFLPSFFFLPNYYIDDYYAFGLWEPGYGYQWVRVGADALLVNMATGEVVDVVPGVYYY